MTFEPNLANQNLTKCLENKVENDQPSWHRSLATAIRSVEDLAERLQLPTATNADDDFGFPVMVPESYLRRMQMGQRNDPLLLQVLPQPVEQEKVEGFSHDPLEEADAHFAEGVLQKYAGRALLIVNGVCAVHCRYCFRRHYPYGEEPRRWNEWQQSFQAIEGDPSIEEVILSGGDPLMLTDDRLQQFVNRIAQITHVKRLRIHSRLPIVLPNRVHDGLITMLTATQLKTVMVVHANHPNEIQHDCVTALEQLVDAGLMVLNQSVLLRRVNDSIESLVELSRRLINLGVLPYYLHQLDRVAGAAHFEVPEQRGLELVAEMRKQLPGYGVPSYVRETPNDLHKTVLG